MKFTKVTQAKNTLVYPKDTEARNSLLAIKSSFYSLRNTNRPVKIQQPKRPNLAAVIRNVDKSLSDDDISEATGFQCKRMHSAARECPIASVKIIFTTIEEKEKAIKQGLHFALRKHKVEDYRVSRPLQCLNCMQFGHPAKECPRGETQICKKCSGDHQYKECTAN